jgi:hypothetical protein
MIISSSPPKKVFVTAADGEFSSAVTTLPQRWQGLVLGAQIAADHISCADAEISTATADGGHRVPANTVGCVDNFCSARTL